MEKPWSGWMTRPPRALSAVQEKQREAEAGLARYREKLNRKFGDVLRLPGFGVAAVGFERLVSKTGARWAFSTGRYLGSWGS
uniref:Uncharacterized protein n=1 Tax=Candidatus Kentrum sp. FM TaxID=2126340 RepID=A0A450TFU2_9GAMM|nr:MAG: hypothetical protein BECKFM1743C_GA0114222_104104 [Candidatus Kentron sp. FM]VFJ66141.1 MAG: hypothetical protein BECKFM1743A_GA0114220_104034 [Candidatus Kentron sp. FM]